MKFKYGDKVQVNTEFYGHPVGIVRRYNEESGNVRYVVAFSTDDDYLFESFSENDLTLIKEQENV